MVIQTTFDYMLSTRAYIEQYGKPLAFYPDGTVAIMYEGRKINYSIFNKLSRVQQNGIVENKRLGSVLAYIQQQHEALEK